MGGREDQLFDLQVDPQERRNLVRQLPAIANELRSVLRRYQDRTPIRASPRRTVAPDQREMLRQLGYVDED
jgi:hypothetical protein